MRSRRTMTLAILCLAGATSTAAQGPPAGVGRPPTAGPPPSAGTPPGEIRGGGVPTAAFIQPAPAETFRPRLFGAWVDSADVLPPGEVWASFYASRWQAHGTHGADFSLADVTAGVARGVQLGFSVPYHVFSADMGDTTRGMGDAYLSAKVRVARSADQRAGIALVPALEFLGASSAALGYRRVNLVLPVSAHVDRGPVRVTGTGGYFTRGSLFGSGSLEARLGARAGVGGTLTHAYSTEDNRLDETLADRRRTDVSGSAYLVASPALIFFGGVGQTVGGADRSLAATVFSVGAAVNLARPGARQP